MGDGGSSGRFGQRGVRAERLGLVVAVGVGVKITLRRNLVRDTRFSMAATFPGSWPLDAMAAVTTSFNVCIHWKIH